MMRRFTPHAVLLLLEALLLLFLAGWKGWYCLLPVAGLCWQWSMLRSRCAAAAVLMGGLCGFGWLLPGGVEMPLANATGGAVVALVAGVVLAFFGIMESLAKVAPTSLDALMVRMTVMGHLAVAGVFFMGARVPVAMGLVLAGLTAGVGLLMAADTLMKIIVRLYTPKRHWSQLPALGAFFFLRWAGAEGKACFPQVANEPDEFSLKLPEMWMWPALRAQLPNLLIAIVAVLWLTTSVHEIPVGCSGVRHAVGKWQESPLAPGFHVCWPWPLGGVQQVDTGKVHEIVLGFRADPGQPILWERAHYEDEQMSLVGGGDDFLSISVPILYRIVDPIAYLRGAADPARLVADAGNRILLDLTLRRAAAEIMTAGREEIRQEFRQRLQEELDRGHSGIGVEQVCLRDVHPPVAVAPTFQEVLSAMEDREAMIHEAESYARDITARSRGDSRQVVVAAEAAARNRSTRVQGEVARFEMRREAWSQAPTLFQWREGYRLFDEALEMTKKVICDDHLRSTLPLQLDLRKVLNPDLVERTPAVQESLIPQPAKSRDAFDLDIEGFLKMDRGELPAVKVGEDDPDQLLKTNVPQK